MLLVVAAVLLGCILQRISGMGTGLVVSPALVLALGPVSGVFLTNVTTVASALLMTYAMRAGVDWGRFVRIAPVVVLGAVPAGLLVREASRGWLELVIGTVLLLALAGTVLVPDVTVAPTTRAGVAAGVTGGFLNTAVGVSGPAMLVYARLTRWEHRGFAATLQPIFLTMGIVSVLAKLSLGATGFSGLPPWPMLVGAVATVPFGAILGGWVATRVSARSARRAAFAVVTAGALGTLLRGAVTVLGRT